MSDVKDHVSGRGGNAGAVRLFRDEGDGTFTEVDTSNLRGWDATSLLWSKLLVDHATGALIVTSAAGGVASTVDQGAGGSSAWKVDGSAVTQPVSAAALPLPAGAATGAKQDTGNTSLASIDSKLTSPVSVTTGGLTDAQLRASAVPVTGTFFQGTQPVSVSTLPLPTGAAKDSTLTDGSARVGGTVTVSGAVTASWAAAQHVIVDTAPTTVVTGPLTDTQLRATAVPVDGSAVTQPVSDSTGNVHLAAIRDSLNELAFLAALDSERSIFS